MSCFHCGKKLNELKMVLISQDGDFVCDETCEAAYEKARDHFFNVIIHDDQKFANYMGVGIDLIK